MSQQYYNNVQIKKRDEWKAVFMISEKSFEPTVMFFGLTNSPTIFKTIMNEILWNLINIKEVTSFIDNIIVKTEEKERHNKVVKKLAKNNLYVKLEKCK